MKRWINIISAWLLLLVFCCSCCGLKKSKTIATTTEVYRVDTVIQVRIDTVVRTVTGYLYDTVRIENQVAEARTYFDITKQRIVLELKGKTFGVPIKVNKVVTTNSKKIDVERKEPLVLYAIILSIVILLMFVISKLVDKYIL